MVNTNNLLCLKFSEVPIPLPLNGRRYGNANRYEKFGEDNAFPQLLNNLYLGSAKHQALIDGKAMYIEGKGISFENKDFNDTPKAKAFKNKYCRLLEKTIKDYCIYGGFYLKVVPTNNGGLNFYHAPFENVRKNYTQDIYFYKEPYQNNYEWQENQYKKFSGNYSKEVTIFEYKRYHPGAYVYAMPEYIGGLNFINADVEVGKHTNGNAESGFNASKMISFFNGEPPKEAKDAIENGFNEKFTGSKGAKVIISFNNENAKKPEVDDLGASDLTKEDFTAVDDLIANNIFTCHEVGAPELFGVVNKNHSLGGNSGAELKIKYDIFCNTYVFKKQQIFNEVFSLIADCDGITETVKITTLDFVGIEFSESTIKELAPRAWLMEKLGIDESIYTDLANNNSIVKNISSLSPLVANKIIESMSANEIRAIVQLPPLNGGENLPTAITATEYTAPVELAGNEHLKNLTGRQFQNIERIKRKLEQNKISKETAIMMLTNSLAITTNEAEIMLANSEQFNEIDSEEFSALVFDSHGEKSEYFEVFNVRPVNKTDTVENRILETYKSNNKITAKEIAAKENIEIEVAESVLGAIKKGGGNILGTRNLPKFEVRYQYGLRKGVDGPAIIEKTRPFCKQVINSNKLYSATDIQKMSAILGYDVMARSGGFWNRNGKVSIKCRHEFKALLVVKK